VRITRVSTTATFGRYRVGAALGQGGMFWLLLGLAAIAVHFAYPLTVPARGRPVQRQP